MTDQPATERKKPGRKAETPAQRLARLQLDLAAARRAVEEAEQRQLATIGKAVMEEAGESPEFRKQLDQLLRKRVTTKAGKAAIASVLDASPGTS